MRSGFIQDVEALAKGMTERLPKTKEGGIIILAVDDCDDGEELVSIVANKAHRRQLVRAFLSKEDLQQDIIDFLEGED